jgi:hypothetical protein
MHEFDNWEEQWNKWDKNICLTILAIACIEAEKNRHVPRVTLAQYQTTAVQQLVDRGVKTTGKKAEELKEELAKDFLQRKAELETASSDPRLFEKHLPKTN